MGQCLSAEQAPPGQKAHTGARSAQYIADDGGDRAVVEGLSEAYRVIKLLGSGAEGNTWLVQDVKTSIEWAVKLIRLPLPSRFVQAIFREIKLQSELGEGHHNIITPEEVILTNHYLGLVMEYAPGGSLTHYITHKFKECRGVGLLVPEDEARYLFKQIVAAVDYCHRHHVVHRDLKLDNTLLSGHNPPYIKLCDFGFARGWGEDSHFTTVIGTPDYMSPQITAAKAQGKALYDGTKADVWAMGVLLCVVLIGKFPFEGDSVSTMGVNDPMKKVWVQQNKTTWSQNALLRDQLPYLSPEATDLLDRMFELDEKKRIDIKGIMAHPWYNTPMRPHFEDALTKLGMEQEAVEKKVAAGAYRSKQRDQAISNLIKLSASEEFRQKATEPITAETVFQIWTRVSLRTVQDSYPVFNKQSLRACMAAHRVSMTSTSQYGLHAGGGPGALNPHPRPMPVHENAVQA
uniref:Protein kinase domain-containing protein n=1 Tax=Chlamydomonas leiostraca TaxID=1034604 RepID=A0A7S0WUB7_9CHLO|mmetsp:Transcript_29413/g.75031  ORF Transcript_29413/g.75031 Transcript_29413/m.75031 type:complete len:460 (+) Transcript_29413:137-1516(+)